jgi:serine/threonine protein kinase
MMFEALTGITPLKGGSSMETLMIRRHEFAPSLNEAVPGLRFPSAVVSLVARALEHDPNDRHENVEMLLSELQKLRVLHVQIRNLSDSKLD